MESGTEVQPGREDADTDRRFQLGYEACERLLAGFDPREPHEKSPEALEA